uniref:Uncharacterized protein n=1 Tax=Anguilla anguilla TaxID=7936 RepID=A0A0E9V219_ANGAN
MKRLREVQRSYTLQETFSSHID